LRWRVIDSQEGKDEKSKKLLRERLSLSESPEQEVS